MGSAASGQFVSPTNLAKEWDVSPKTIRKYIATGELPAVKFGPTKQATVRIPRAAADAWLAARAKAAADA